jgi:hypothetical protein
MLGLAAALALGCEKGATPGPTSFQAADIRTTPIATIQKFVYAQLQFDSILGADSEPVDFRQGQIGTKTAKRARIEPETRSYLLTRRELGEGRFIGRIYSDDTVPSLGLGPWWAWWWVDSSATGHWRSVLIPQAGTPPYPVPLDSLEVEDHGGRRFTQALARFQVVSVNTPHGDPPVIASWGTCTGCCKQLLPVTPLH